MSRRHPLFVLSLLAAGVAFVLAAAGCGGSSGSGGSHGVASLGPSSNAAATTQPGPVAYSHCMRSNGVPAFPDLSSASYSKSQVVAARRSNPNKFDAASTTCAHLLPNESLAPQQTPQQARTQLRDELSFARCMRTHGVSGFPDPTGQQGLSVQMVESHGIDVHSPQILRVVQTCLPASHGGLTAAKVREALTNNH